MDTIFVEGIGAVVSAIIIFGGSVWLLLTMVLGARLAYFVTASVTLAFVVMMGVVWSINPLGPVGDLPGWDETGVSEDVAELEGPNASSYPEAPWEEFEEEDAEEDSPVQNLEVPPVPSPEPTPASELPDEDALVYALFELDPGNPLGTARTITLGGFVLLVLHLFGLGRSERRSKA